MTTKKYDVQVPEGVSKSKIVFFSDTHFGKMYDQSNIEKIVKKINSQKPDIVIFGGDLLDNYARDKSLLDLEYLSNNLASIKANYGKYAILGNNDYSDGAINVYNEIMNSSGFSVIKNDNVFIDKLGIKLIGFDDLLLGDTDPSFYSIKSEDFNIILSHEPDVANKINLKNYGLMLSGHSHGGQVSIPYITQKILPAGAKEYIKGRYNNVGINNNIDLFVSKGIGMTLVPFRLFNIPEIMVLDLTSN
ncbi:metallophosphoesterase [Romboutsia sp.]|uniref:metallophosphoesterase n=1 Tax=Romboutsia sp. TaxID=1965302 RepID=UPI003F418FF9